MKKAPEGKVLRAMMMDINPFARGLIRRVLIDEWGMVFVPTWGWSNLQDSYKLVVFPGVFEKFSNLRDGDWWEKRGWQHPTWSWCYFYKVPSFHPCRMDSEGFVFAA